MTLTAKHGFRQLAGEKPLFIMQDSWMNDKLVA